MSPRDKTAHTAQPVYARHSLGGVWWLGFLLIPLVIAVLLTITRHGAMQDDLRADSLKALDAQGIHGVTVAFNGRNATIGIPIWMDQNAPRTTVEDVNGVSSVLVGTLDADNPYSLSSCTQTKAILAKVGSGHLTMAGPHRPTPSSVVKLRRVAQLINACDLLRVRISGAQAAYLKQVLVTYHIAPGRIVVRPPSSGVPAIQAL